MMYAGIIAIWFVCGILIGRWTNNDKTTNRDMVLWQQGYNCGWNDHKQYQQNKSEGDKTE